MKAALSTAPMRTGDFMGAVAPTWRPHRQSAQPEGTRKALVTTGGTMVLALGGFSGRPGTEDDQPTGGPRTDAANYVTGLAERGGALQRRAAHPMVHSDLDHHGFTVA